MADWLKKIRSWVDGDYEAENALVTIVEEQSKTPNLRLQTDNQKISGHHAEINLEPNGEIWVTGLHGKNPTIVDNKRLSNGEKAIIGADKTIEIYDFVLKLTFAE